jgi:hypothetical protein
MEIFIFLTWGCSFPYASRLPAKEPDGGPGANRRRVPSAFPVTAALLPAWQAAQLRQGDRAGRQSSFVCFFLFGFYFAFISFSLAVKSFKI